MLKVFNIPTRMFNRVSGASYIDSRTTDEGGSASRTPSWNRKVHTLEEIKRLQGWGVPIEQKWIDLHTSSEPPCFYRIIGPVERDLLIRGESITGARYSDKDRLDVTTNPDYGRIPRTGKFLVKFKLTERFDPLAQNTHITDHKIENDEFYLSSGYSMKDVESIAPIGPIN